ncbi:unnamed protein product, partial [Effrenium voratum]
MITPKKKRTDLAAPETVQEQWKKGTLARDEMAELLVASNFRKEEFFDRLQIIVTSKQSFKITRDEGWYSEAEMKGELAWQNQYDNEMEFWADQAAKLSEGAFSKLKDLDARSAAETKALARLFGDACKTLAKGCVKHNSWRAAHQEACAQRGLALQPALARYGKAVQLGPGAGHAASAEKAESEREAARAALLDWAQIRLAKERPLLEPQPCTQTALPELHWQNLQRAMAWRLL